MPELTQLKDLSPPIVLWVVLNIVAIILKRVPQFPDWLIPVTSVVLGGIIYPLVTDPGKVSFAVRCPVCAQVLTGMMAGGIAVASHAQFKQFMQRFGLSTGDTEIITPEDK